MGSVGQASKRFSLVLIHSSCSGITPWWRSRKSTRSKAATCAASTAKTAGPACYKHVKLVGLVWRYGGLRRLKRDPDAIHYTDLALTPVEEDRSQEMELAAMGAGPKSGVVKIH